MGEVWHASHRLLARPAAVKLVRPDVLGEDEASRLIALRRFEREARERGSGLR
jgi:serine/threonine-protein kinase